MRKNNGSLDMTVGDPTRLLTAFALPMLFGAFFDLMYNMVDAIVLGRFVSTEALASVGATTSVTGMIIMIGFAFTQSVSILISQAWGAGRRDLHRLAGQSFVLCLAVSAVLGGLSCAVAESLTMLLGVPENIRAGAVVYIRIVCGMGVARLFYNTSAAVLRAVGDSRTPLVFLIVCSVLNVLLDLLFVAVLGMTVAGVAWATVISQIASAVLCCLYLWKKYPVLRFARKDMLPERKMQSGFVGIALPIALRDVLLTGGQMVIAAVVNSFGSDVVAAYTVGGRVEQLAFITLSQIECAFAVYTGQNFGAKCYDRIHYGLKRALMLLGCAAAVTMAVLFAFGHPLVLMFVQADESAVVTAALRMIHIEAAFLPAFGVICMYNSMLRGMGFVNAALVSSVVELVSKVGFSLMLSGMLGYTGAWLASPLGWVVGLTVSVGYYHSGRWKRKLQAVEG